MATQVPVFAVRVVNASNAVLEATGAAGSATQVPSLVLRAVASTGKIIESTGSAGSVDGLAPSIAVRVVDSTNHVINSSGAASSTTQVPVCAVRFVGSDDVAYGSGSGAPMMDVRIVDETNTILDALFGGGGASNAGLIIGFPFGLTYAA